MLELFKNMMKEEWRIHSSIFGSFMFALFPIMLAIFAFIGSLMLPILSVIIPLNQLWLILQYTFLLFGISVGSFGLFGREVMNRRFGRASLLAYSSRSLPVSEKNIFLNFLVKDLIYYFVLWILPFVVGFAIASPLLSISLIYSLSLLLTATLSFLMGLSIVFLLSTIYAHSSKVLVGLLVLIGVVAAFTMNYLNFSLLIFSFLPSAAQIIASLIVIIVPTSLALVFLKVDYPQKKKSYKNYLDRISRFLSFSKLSTLMSKDFLDFNRSEGGVGKIIFSFILPLAIIWLIIFTFLRFIPVLNLFIVFSIFLGILSTSFYNWFTEFDSFTSYSFLPVEVSTLIRSKINSYVLINLIPLAVLIIFSFWIGQTSYFLPALFSFIAVSSYTLSITIFLTGLNPHILLYNAKIFTEYIILISPVLIALIFLSMLNPFYLIVSLLLVPISYSVIKKGYEKWDKIEQPYL